MENLIFLESSYDHIYFQWLHSTLVELSKGATVSNLKSAKIQITLIKKLKNLSCLKFFRRFTSLSRFFITS